MESEVSKVLTKYDIDTVIKNFALSIVNNPQGNLKDHIDAVGISNATFYRIFSSKIDFEYKLKKKIQAVLSEIICISGSSFDDYYVGLRLIIEAHISNREIICLLCTDPTYQEFSTDDLYDYEFNYWIPYKKALNDFFRKSQNRGDLKLKCEPQMLTIHFIFTIVGVVSAAMNGDIAEKSVAKEIEELFLHGVSNKENGSGLIEQKVNAQKHIME